MLCARVCLPVLLALTACGASHSHPGAPASTAPIHSLGVPIGPVSPSALVLVVDDRAAQGSGRIQCDTVE